MTPQEMHIGINLLLQKVNSNITSSLRPEELDWFLNEDVLRYIKQTTDPLSNSKKIGDQDTQKKYDDLKALIVPKTLPVYTRDSKSVFAYLPSDYIALKNDRSLTKDLCGAVYAPTTTSASIYYTTFKLPTTVNGYSAIIISINSVIVFDSSNYPNFVSNTATLKAKFEYIDFIVQAIRDAGYECKYESYLNLFFRESIIIASTSNITVTIGIGIPVIITNYTTIVINKTRIDNVANSLEVENRLTKTEKIYKLLPLAFGSTLSSSPLSTLERDSLIVYHNQKFIVSSVNIDYIRKPKKISLLLNQGCELDENVHSEIVENTAKRIAALVASQNYQLLKEENINK